LVANCPRLIEEQQKKGSPPLSEHLNPAELSDSLHRTLSPERRREILSHLLTGCKACRSAIGWNRRVRKSLQVSELPLAWRVAAYDQPVASTFEQAIRLKRVLEEQQEQAREASALLARGERLAAIPEEAGLGLYEALLQRVSALRHDDPQETVRLARMAVTVADRLDPAVYGERQKADFEARAWGELGNALRAADDLWEAEQAFEHAFDVLERGTGAKLLVVRLHDLHASLLGTQRRFQLAFFALDVVRNLYREAGDNHAVGRVLIKKALYLHYSGQSEEALKVNAQGLASIDEARDPELSFTAFKNHLWYSVDCGRFREAKRLLFRNRNRVHTASRIPRLKILWLEGRIRYGLEELASAEATFLEVKQGFEEAGLGFAAALASLDAALVQMRLDRPAEAESLVTSAAALFAALGIHREALSAVMLLKEAFQRQTATTVLVERTVAFLRESENNPDASYVSRLD
jgi:tetratricopeptide (TPR) repeat protein